MHKLHIARFCPSKLSLKTWDRFTAIVDQQQVTMEVTKPHAQLDRNDSPVTPAITTLSAMIASCFHAEQEAGDLQDRGRTHRKATSNYQSIAVYE